MTITIITTKMVMIMIMAIIIVVMIIIITATTMVKTTTMRTTTKRLNGLSGQSPGFGAVGAVGAVGGGYGGYGGYGTGYGYGHGYSPVAAGLGSLASAYGLHGFGGLRRDESTLSLDLKIQIRPLHYPLRALLVITAASDPDTCSLDSLGKVLTG